MALASLSSSHSHAKVQATPALSRWTSPPSFLFLTVSQFLTVHELLLRVERVNSRWHLSRLFGWSAISFPKSRRILAMPRELQVLIEGRTQNWLSCVRHVVLPFGAPYFVEDNWMPNLCTLTLDAPVSILNISQLPLRHLQFRYEDGDEFWCFSHLLGLQTLKIDGDLKLDDHDLQHLSALTSLHTLHVRWSICTTLQPLAALTRLRELCFDHARLGDHGLAPVASLTQLTSLSINQCRVSDDGLAHLVGLHNLTELWLNGNPIDGSGLKHIAKLSLCRLSLRLTHITDEAIPLLQPLADSLRELFLGCDLVISDTGVRLIGATLPNLTKLQVDRVTCLTSGFPNLREVEIDASRNAHAYGMSASVSALARARPELTIRFFEGC